MVRLPSRQVHLDFHTSEFMPGVGTKYSKENFQKALKIGHLNSITIFAKCHHSWSYYPTKAGKMHPTLHFDFTGAMMDAAHEIGVRAPIYITVGWSANDAEKYPANVVKKKDGGMTISAGNLNAKPEEKRPIVSWKFMCPNGEYAKLIYNQTKEICERYDTVDGLFYDICFGPLCWCEDCIKGMKSEGLNPDDEEDAQIYHRMLWQHFMTECTDILRAKHKDATIFFNGGADLYHHEWHDWQSHFEMEDLPTTWGGYDKMPPRAKYFAKSGKDYLGMTGKFHTTWGEFGGFKTADAMKYECAAMLTYGARCSIGDQMHPSGEMDLETYRLIGEAYQYVEKIEPWCYDTEETTRLGVVLSKDPISDEGLEKILLESHLDFDIVRENDDLTGFDTIILPDCILLDETSAGRINDFVNSGGSLLLTGTSGLNKGKTQFLIDVGANYQGAALYENDYLQLSEKLVDGLVSSPFLFYAGAEYVSTTNGEILASIKEPYFNRTYGHYCSHQNTPYKLETAEHPGAVRKGNVVYLAHAVCRLYYLHGAQFHRDYLINALKLIYKSPVMSVEMMSSGRARFVNQPKDNRYILHLLYAAPVQRGRASVIEDLPPIYNVKASMKIKETVKKAYLAPQGAEIPFKQAGSTVNVVIPELICHQMVVFDY